MPLGHATAAQTLDAENPVNWNSPVNRGLVSRWQVFAHDGGFNGRTLARDLCFARNLPNNATYLNVPPGMLGVGVDHPGGHGAYLFSTDKRLNATVSFLNGTAAATLSVWLRRLTSGSTVSVGAYTSTSNRFMIESFSDGNVYFEVANGAVSFGSAVNAGAAWFHYTLTYDGAGSGNSGKLQGYVNGRAATLSYTSTIPNTAGGSTSFDIGSRGSAIYGSGWVDDVRLYNRWMPADEVFRLYADSYRGSPDSLRWMPAARRTWNAVAAPPPTTAYRLALLGVG